MLQDSKHYITFEVHRPNKLPNNLCELQILRIQRPEKALQNILCVQPFGSNNYNWQLDGFFLVPSPEKKKFFRPLTRRLPQKGVCLCKLI